MYVCVCVYACMHACMHVCIYIHAYAYVYIYICTHIILAQEFHMLYVFMMPYTRYIQILCRQGLYKVQDSKIPEPWLHGTQNLCKLDFALLCMGIVSLATWMADPASCSLRRS